MEDFLWVEKYRPKTISECVLPSGLKQTLSEFISKGDLPNLILSGGPGVGKTTAAKALIEELGLTYMMINGSEESGIDTLWVKLKNYASTVSLHGGRKYLILDEADYLNAQSTQPALRGLIEEFHKNCGFILTCNYKNRLIPPLHSRCSVVDFTIQKSEKKELAEQFFKKVNHFYLKNSYYFTTQMLQKLLVRLLDTKLKNLESSGRKIYNEFKSKAATADFG